MDAAQTIHNGHGFPDAANLTGVRRIAARALRRIPVSDFAQPNRRCGVLSTSEAFAPTLARMGFSMARFRTLVLAAGAAALVSGQAAYAAPSPTAPRIDPLVSLSVLASAASQAAVCAGSTAAAAAATAAQGVAPGCVLPVTAPPPVPVGEVAPPPPPPPAPGTGIGTLPLLLGLAAILGVAALLLLSDDNDNGDATPVSPA